MQCWVWISSWLKLAVCEFSNLFLSMKHSPVGQHFYIWILKITDLQNSMSMEHINCEIPLLYLDLENCGSTKFHVHETFHLWDTTFIFGSWKSWIYKIGNWIYKILNLYNCTEARMPVVNDLHAEISVKILQISSNFHRESFPILL